MKSFIKIKISVFAIVLIFNSFISVPRAEASWPDFAGNIGGEAVGQIWTMIEKLIMAELKQAAIQTLNETVNNMIAGATGAGSAFINDWEDYLFKSPKSEASAYMNDFFTITTRGKSSGNFQSSCGGGSFAEWRSAGAKESVGVEIDYSSLQADFDEYACDAAEMFTEGSWDAFNAFMQPNNNPIAYALVAESVHEEKLTEKKEEAAWKGISYQGFNATESDSGIVLTPGSITEEITASANTASDKALIEASSWQEVAAAVVGKIATKVVKQGIGNARQNVQNEINNQICDASQGLQDELSNLSPNGNLPGGVGIGSLGSSSSGSSCSY